MIWKVLKFFSFWTSLGALSVLAVSAIYKPETLPHIPMCSFKTMTGRPCPGCGLTRAFCAISHGRVGEAFYFNPFAFVFYAGMVGVALWPLAAHFFPSLKTWLNKTRLFVWLLPGVMVAMLIYGLFRMKFGPFV
ncbi:MAG TPA: DUF2752 domain-containing protein [Planctomycetota bacterium]|nr:DUF2752 domain-containing protein [Planctomycetota bacterium]